jgi:hypothetical protein
MVGTIEWGEIRGTRITFPMEVARFNAVSMAFDVPATAAARLLPGDAFELVEADGIAQFILNVCDYIENPWGDYNEVNLGFLARPRGAGEEVIGSFVYRMPVNQEFTCEAGNKVMGFPKTVEAIEVTYSDRSVEVTLDFDGQRAFKLTIPRVESPDEPARMETVSYSYLDTVGYATPLELDLASGTVEPDLVVLELGTGVVADELRSMGLPKAPGYCSWGEGLSATFQLGTRV